MFWDSLPAEIQVHILEALVLHDDSARYASICRAWQTVIEGKNFAHLKVTRSRLAGFSDIGYRHRHLVECICFSIEPSEQHCPQCGGMGLYNWAHAPTKLIRKAIQDLVIELITWEPSGRLQLDISLKAPSALRFSSNTIQYGPGVFSKPKKARIIQCSHWLHDPSERGQAAYMLNRSTEVSKPEPEPKPSQTMPKARAVTSLLLRRQTRHQWKSEVLEELLDLLPKVHEIHYEPWRDWRRMEERPATLSKAGDTLL